jgi:arylsulfatase A-like enzyme
MSVYPTLCDLTSVPKPALLEGDNINPLLSDPAAAWTGVAITTFGQNNHAIRTDRWRYIRYADGTEELYDHENDEYEWTNQAGKPEHAAHKDSLAKHFPTNNVPPSSTGKMSDSDGAPDKTSDPKKIKRKARKAAAQ